MNPNGIFVRLSAWLENVANPQVQYSLYAFRDTGVPGNFLHLLQNQGAFCLMQVVCDVSRKEFFLGADAERGLELSAGGSLDDLPGAVGA